MIIKIILINKNQNLQISFLFFQARRDIVIESKNKFVYCRECDLASQASIRDFVKQFKQGIICVKIQN